MKNEMPKELVNLLRVVNDLTGPSKAHLCPELDALTEMVMHRQRILDLIQEAWSQVRLDTKYLIFDLEATRRERDEALKA